MSLSAIRVIDSHTGGEPTRLVTDGFPDLGDMTMQDRASILAKQYDHYRRAVVLEPRGNDVLVGALLCKPVNPKASAGVIFFNNKGYLGMCGHGTIGLMVSLRYLGLVDIGEHLIETPVGDVFATIHDDNTVSVKNVYAYRYKKGVIVDVPTLGEIKGDIAWGGNWFFLVDSDIFDIHFNNVEALTQASRSIMKSLEKNNITGKDGALIDHVELFGPSKYANSQNFVLCPGGSYDRSPCGTGTSAKLACLADSGLLKEGETWVQESIVGSQFSASYTRESKGIIPTIRGSAFISGDNKILIDEKDPFAWGIATEVGH